MNINRKKLKELTKTSKDSQQLGLILAGDFSLFLSFLFFHLNGELDASGDGHTLQGSNYIFKDFHYTMINGLTDYAYGINKKRNLIINIFPRSGKTTLMIYFIAWCLARNPRSKYIYTSYSSTLAEEVSTSVRAIIKSDLFSNCYPHYNVTRHKDKKGLWELEGFNGGMYATELGGQLTGFGAGVMGSPDFSGCLIIDDPIKVQDITSQAERSRKWRYYKETVKNRLNSPITPIIIIMQRLDQSEDLCGYIENEPCELIDYKIIKIPICDEEITKSIWEEQHSIKYLKNLKSMNPYYFYSQYQQTPIIKGGQIIKSEWFRHYDSLSLIKIRRIFITGDTAMKIKEHNDYSVFCLWALDNFNNLYLVDMIRGKWEMPNLISNLLEFWMRWRAGVNGITCGGVYVEDKSSGTSLIQVMKLQSVLPMIPVQVHKDKLTRVELCLDFIHAGKVNLPLSKISIVSDLILECENFTRIGTHKHDDIVDNLTMAIGIAQGMFLIPAGAICEVNRKK